MRAQTFLAKVGVKTFRQMDERINQWLAKNEVEPKFINQVFGYEHRERNQKEDPVLITTIWY